MNQQSALVPDGFGPSFYPVAWATIKPELMDLLSGFHQGSIQLEHINRLFMVLIPKKLGATMVDALRPICLQNCSIKILAKTLMISKEIGRLIDLNQTGFLSGRSISETFVFVAEVVQACHKHKFLHWS